LTIFDIFEISYEESVSYFKSLENLEKIRRTNVLNPKHNMWCHYCDKNNHNTADCREIARFKQQKKAQFEAKARP
jgi:hypothetical protein